MEQGKERFVDPLDLKSLKKKNQQNNQNQDSDMVLYSVEYPKTSLDLLVVPEKTKQQIASILTKIKHFDLLYNKFGLKQIDRTGGRTLINFYGPPGTGKTYLAEKLSKQSGGLSRQQTLQRKLLQKRMAKKSLKQTILKLNQNLLGRLLKT